MPESGVNFFPTRLARTGNEIHFSLEKPKRTSLVVFPTVREDGKKIRTGLHTDRIGNVMEYLRRLSREERQALRIEGRVLDENQWLRLQDDPVYKFFLNGRWERVQRRDQEKVLRLLLPKGLALTHEDVLRLAQLAYSPVTSAATIGYQVGYFSADDMYNFWYRGDNNANDLKPILGGCNEFSIGSDTFSPVKLKSIAVGLEKVFIDNEYEDDVVKRGKKLAVSEERIRQIFDVHDI